MLKSFDLGEHEFYIHSLVNSFIKSFGGKIIQQNGYLCKNRLGTLL